MKLYTVIEIDNGEPVVIGSYSTMERAQQQLAKYAVASGIEFVDYTTEPWGKRFWGSYEGDPVYFEIQVNFLDDELEFM